MKTFYQNILKQDIVLDFGNCISFEGGLSIWESRNDYAISKRLGRTISESGNQNLELSFETDNFGEVTAYLGTLNLEFLHGIVIEPWGQQTIRFYDPDKNLVEIGESMSNFFE